jgi:hypothetical protein
MPVSRFFTIRSSSNRFHASVLEVLVRQRAVCRRRETIRTFIFRLDATGYRAPRNEEFMSMDRLSRVIAGGCLTLALSMVITASGCRSMKNDVPKGKQFSTNGNPPAVGFNSDAHPNTSIGNGMYPGNGSDPNAMGSGAQPQFGTPANGLSPLGTPTSGRYGAPGTAGSAPN